MAAVGAPVVKEWALARIEEPNSVAPHFPGVFRLPGTVSDGDVDSGIVDLTHEEAEGSDSAAARGAAAAVAQREAAAAAADGGSEVDEAEYEEASDESEPDEEEVPNHTAALLGSVTERISRLGDVAAARIEPREEEPAQDAAEKEERAGRCRQRPARYR